MALNECAVDLYVIIIEKKKVLIHLNRLHFWLMFLGVFFFFRGVNNYDFSRSVSI